MDATSHSAAGLSGDSGPAGGAARPARSADYLRLLHGIYDAVLLTDAGGRILDWNDRACEFFGCAYGLAGASVFDLISGTGPSLMDTVCRSLSEHRYTLLEAECVRRDRTVFPAEIAVNRMDSEGGCEFCFFVRNVAERKGAEAALREAVARLEAHDKARLQFVTNVSHELRTPLTSMLYAVTNMLRGVVGEMPERARHYLELLDGDCKRLLGTVNDILDLREIENQTLAVNRARIPLSRLVRLAADSLRVQAEKKGIALNVAASDVRYFVDGDPHKLQRVILNVVGNAIKYTPDGGRIEVDVDPDPDRAGHVRVRVLDTGIGIPSDAIDKVTVRFFRVCEQPSGSGLGLAISKDIVELHGGALIIRSPPPGAPSGTGVYISLPQVDSPTVLIGVESERLRELLKRQINGAGYKVWDVRGGAEAMKRLEQGRPDLLILGLEPANRGAADVVMKIKGDPATRRVPLIVIAGRGADRARLAAFNNLCIPILSAPWSEAGLLDIMAGAFLGTRRAARASAPTRTRTRTRVK